MKIGDYVRTKIGISKCIKEIPIRENSFMYEFDKEVYEDVVYLTASELDKYKSSSNILDLIEEHDLVVIEYYAPRYNARINRLFEVSYKFEGYITIKNAYCEFMLKNNEFNDKDKKLNPIIKSIVTKEQFKEMEYKI